MALISISLAAPLARAQPAPTRPEVAATSASDQAEVLFRQAKQRMDEKKFSEACGLYAESQRLDPAGGTLLALASCHEAEGHLATAWAEYNAVIALSKVDGHGDREEVAKQRAAAIEPKLGRLTIEVSDKARALGGFRVRRDGADVGPSLYGISIPVDPGEHVIDSSAEGRVASKKTVRIEAGTIPVVVRLDELALDAAPPPSAPPQVVDKPVTSGDAQRVAGIVGLGLGVVAGAFATSFAIDASSKASSAERTCPRGLPCHDADAAALSRTAGRSADLATGLLIGAIASGAVGLVLVLTAPRARKTAAIGAPLTLRF